jgi:hypothetical protein
LKGLQEQQTNEFMYLPPWALQEGVLRNPNRSRGQQLEKAGLSFQVLFQDFDRSSLPHDVRVPKRFSTRSAQCLTFTDDPGWLRVLNSALLLIGFIKEENENESFSRLGAHRLENFLIRFDNLRTETTGSSGLFEESDKQL